MAETLSRDGSPPPPGLTCDGLSVVFPTAPHPLIAVDDVALSLRPGRILGVVGESGSGKSQLFLALTGLTPAASLSGHVWFAGQDLIAVAEADRQRIRGRRIAYIFQDPMTALNPYLRVVTQLTEVARVHLGLSHADALTRARQMLDKVRIPDADRRLRSFPHELSGGMRQRVMIAMALMAEPDVIIADEPTTALDATVQIQVLDLLRELCDEDQVAVALITHDMGVVARVTDDAMVMYAGRIVEQGPTAQLLTRPLHPYTHRLIDSTPDLGRAVHDTLAGIPGQLPEPSAPRDRCLFADRCQRAQDVCHAVQPSLEELAASHSVACHFPTEKSE